MKPRTSLLIPIFTLVLVMLLASCAGAPVWITSRPPDSAGQVFFTGVGSDLSGDVGVAEELATASLVAEISRFIGVRISSETTVEARATLDDYEAEIIELVREQSAAMISDFRITDRYVESGQNGSVNVYLLGAYDSVALSNEKERIRQLMEERVEAFAGPEREGDRLAESGAPYSAAVRYLESAAAALESDMDNASVVFTRVIQKATAGLQSVEIQKVSAPPDGQPGRMPEQPFTVLVAGAGGPLADVPLLVIWTEQRVGGRTGTSTSVVQSDRDGIASFDYPSASGAGRWSIVFTLTFTPQLDALRKAGAEQREIIKGFERAATRISSEFEFLVVSESQSIASSVYITDILESGEYGASAIAALGVQEVLGEAGYTIVPIRSGSGLAGLTITDFLSRVRQSRLSDAERVVHGTARITGVLFDGGVFIARADGTVVVADVATAGIIATFSVSGVARGRSRDAAAEAVLRQTGQLLGEKLERDLP